MAGLFLGFKLIRRVFQTWTELARQAWHREALFVIEVKEINEHLNRSTDAGLHVRQEAGNTSGGNYLLNHKETAHSIFVRSGGISSQTGSWWKSIKGQPVMFQLHQLLSQQETTWGRFYSKTTTKQCSWNMRAADDCLSLLSVWSQQIMWQLQLFPPPPLSATVIETSCAHDVYNGMALWRLRMRQNRYISGGAGVIPHVFIWSWTITQTSCQKTAVPLMSKKESQPPIFKHTNISQPDRKHQFWPLWLISPFIATVYFQERLKVRGVAALLTC